MMVLTLDGPNRVCVGKKRQEKEKVADDTSENMALKDGWHFTVTVLCSDIVNRAPNRPANA